MGSKYFTEESIKDEEWTLSTLGRMARCIRGERIESEKTILIRQIHEAVAEAQIAHPQSTGIRNFLNQRGL